MSYTLFDVDKVEEYLIVDLLRESNTEFRIFLTKFWEFKVLDKDNQRVKTQVMSVLSGLSLALSCAGAYAGATIKIDDTKSISMGVGIRSGFTMQEDGAPDGESYSKDFDTQSVRVYLSGQIEKDWKFTINTEEMYGDYGVLDAMIQYEPSESFNVWAGRLLTPADRIEMNGPYNGITWNQYTVPLYASDADPAGAAGLYGRDEGAVIWGNSGKFQYAIGAFNGLDGAPNDSDSLLYAGRFSYNFLNQEQNPGYYTSGTYYGSLGDIFTLGFSFQSQENGTGLTADDAEDFFGFAVDFIYETVLTKGAVLTLDGEYKSFDTDATTGFTLFDGESIFATAAYLFPQKNGAGRMQPYVRVTQNSPSEGDESELTELGMNYVISGNNLRLNGNITNGDANLSGQAADDDITTFSLGIQLQL